MNRNATGYGLTAGTWPGFAGTCGPLSTHAVQLVAVSLRRLLITRAQDVNLRINMCDPQIGEIAAMQPINSETIDSWDL